MLGLFVHKYRLLWLTLLLLPFALIAFHGPSSTQAGPPTIATPKPAPSPVSPTKTAQRPQLSVAQSIYLPIIVASSTSVPATLRIPNPIVVEQSPAPGEELAPDQPIVIHFDRPMNQSSVEQAFQFTLASETSQYQTNLAPMSGRFVWTHAQTLQFTPSQPLQRATGYRLVIGKGAQTSDGTSFDDDCRIPIKTAGYLEVSKVIPTEKSGDIATDSAITVMFNRPVVALTTVEDQAQLPQPLSFEPAVAGKGEWFNTSIYVFHPSSPLANGTTYTGKIDATLKDATGNPLKSAFSWSFTTALPPEVTVNWVTPGDMNNLAPLNVPIVVQFNQPIDGASASNLFQLTTDNGNAVSGNLNVTHDVLIFTPTQRLAYAQRYQITIEAGVQSGSGGRPMSQRFTSSFTTVPLPQIIATDPTDGQTNAEPSTAFHITFNAPINPDTIMSHLSMTPALSPTQVVTGFYGTTFSLNFGAKPSTSYTIHVEPGIADPYGSTTNQTLDVHFRTKPLEPSVYLAAPDYAATYSISKPTTVRVRAVNVSQVPLALYRLKPEDLLKGYSLQPSDGQLIRRWVAPLVSTPDVPALHRIDLVEGGGSLAPGVYLVQLETTAATYNQPHIMVLSGINLTIKSSEHNALVWANDLQHGQPVSGLVLDFYDKQGNMINSATTDNQGVAQLNVRRATNDGLLVIGREPFAAVDSDWSTGVTPSDFGLPTAYDLPEMAAHIYTDRPIYRPNQTVSFKGVLRAEQDAHFTLPVNLGHVQVTILNPRNEQVYQQSLPTTPYGTFSGSLNLPASASLGMYTINVATRNKRTFSSQFNVAAYRTPEFEVAVVPQTAEAIYGNPIRATVVVSYFFGLPVQYAAVEWSVQATDFSFDPEGFGRYQFQDSDDPWHCWDCWWMPQSPSTMLLKGQGKTDAQGHLVIEIPADLKDGSGKPVAKSVRLTIEATVTGSDNQVISSSSDVILHCSDGYVGLASQTYVGEANKPQQIDLVTTNITGQPRANQSVLVEIFQQHWNNIYLEEKMEWEWKTIQTLVMSQSLTTDQHGLATLSFTLKEGGSYRIVATMHDSAGRQVRSSLFLWVAGEGYVSWRRDNNDRITLITDKTTYHAGETANILIPSPFQWQHWALITIERGSIISHEVISMQGNNTLYHIPITTEHIPNIYISVVLFSPPIAAGVYGSPLPADYKVGILPLTVTPDPQSLRITIKPNTQQATPGQEIRYDVSVNDAEGNPINAELSLDLVDKAVLSLFPRTPNAILKAFYDRRVLGVTTASGMSIFADRILKDSEPKYDDDASDKAPEQPQPTMPIAPTTPDAGAPPNEPGSRNKETGSVTVRENFADTAYWNGHIQTDSAGQASVVVKLPDNLTTWVMRAVGLTHDTKVGESNVDVLSTKPMLIRPVTPRFFVVSDTVELAANVSNRTTTPLTVQVWLQATGLTITTPITQSIIVPSGGEAQATWRVIAQDVAYADVIFHAVSGTYRDSSKPRLATGTGNTLPVYRYSAPEFVGTSGYLREAGSRTEVLALPAYLDQRRRSLTVRLNPSLAASMRDSLTYLEHFEHECTEQTVSRFLPNVMTVQALKRLNIHNSELEQTLPTLVAEGLKKLSERQLSNGGWGWWSLQEEHANPSLSAYVVFSLLQAQQAGFTVQSDVLERGLNYLTNVLANPVKPDGSQPNVDDNRYRNQQAWITYVLVEAGLGDRQYLDELYNQRTTLAWYARAMLALAINKTNPSDARIATLLAELHSAAILSATGAHWEEQATDWWNMNTDVRSTAIILSALVRLDPKNQLNPNVVRWLMIARQGDAWQTSQETVWSIIGLTDWMEATGELKPNYDYAVWLNAPGDSTLNKPIASGHMQESNTMKPVEFQTTIPDILQSKSFWLTIGRGAGSGVLYYNTHLQTFLPVEQVKSLDRGVSIQRRYTLDSCSDGPQCPEITSAKVGDVIRVDLSLVAPSTLYYIVVEDPLPAGAEAIDTSLATTAQNQTPDQATSARKGSWYWWWWQWYNHSEYRDEKVVLFAEHLYGGTYTYRYTIRATQAGEFRIIPPIVYEFYFPEVYGRGDGKLLTIRK